MFMLFEGKNKYIFIIWFVLLVCHTLRKPNEMGKKGKFFQIDWLIGV